MSSAPTPPASGVTNQLAALAARYTGAGDGHLHDWATASARDAAALYIGRESWLRCFALAEGGGMSVARARRNMLERLHDPCGVDDRAGAGTGGGGK
ncbi:hypothetical protein MMPV_005337 [Pyropia vietnamensis]